MDCTSTASPHLDTDTLILNNRLSHFSSPDSSQKLLTRCLLQFRGTCKRTYFYPKYFFKTVQIFLNHYDDKLTQKFSCTSNCLNSSLASTSAILQL